MTDVVFAVPSLSSSCGFLPLGGAAVIYGCGVSGIWS
jgi:hypothetical protein